jgi:hypothetical protein
MHPVRRLLIRLGKRCGGVKVVKQVCAEASDATKPLVNEDLSCKHLLNLVWSAVTNTR